MLGRKKCSFTASKQVLLRISLPYWYRKDNTDAKEVNRLIGRGFLLI